MPVRGIFSKCQILFFMDDIYAKDTTNHEGVMTYVLNGVACLNWSIVQLDK
jgi:hypothetical protein